jgi:hypothetical protein
VAIDQERKTIKKLLFPSAKVFGATELVVQLMVYTALWFCSHTFVGVLNQVPVPQLCGTAEGKRRMNFSESTKKSNVIDLFC